MWINRTPVPIISEENISNIYCHEHTAKKSVSQIHPSILVAWLKSMNYSRLEAVADSAWR
jgi:predicted CxxxxCH...CXXCH cytochrome family protein